MKFKKVMAVTLSMAMVLGCSMTAFAEEKEETTSPATGTSSGAGEVESYVDTDVFAVVLPTDDATIYNFIVDPQGLINATDAAAYTGYTFEEDATLFFANTAADGTVSYSSSSDALTVTNRSTMPVEVEVVATYASDSIGITDDADFTDDNDADVYLALVGGDADAETFDTTGKTASVSTKMDCVEDGSYAFTYDSDTGAYSYKLTDTAGDFDTYSFYLTGASNSNADWSAVTSATASVSVTYTLTESSYDGTTPTFNVSDSDSGTIEYTKGSSDYELVSITSITVINTDGKAYDGYNASGTIWSEAEDTGSSVTFDDKFTAYYTATSSGYTATITYINALGKTVTDTIDGVFASN